MAVFNFRSMKSPVELNSPLSKFFCYIIWLVISPDQTRRWTTCKRGRYDKSYCFFKAIARRIKNHKLMVVLPDITYSKHPFLTQVRREKESLKEERFKGMFKKIPGNVREDSGESSRRFNRMSEKFLGNVQGDFVEFLKRFREIFEKNPGNCRKNSGQCQ